MPSTFSTNLNLELQATGEHSGTWGNVLNTADFAIIDKSLGGVQTISLAGVDVTVTTNQSQNNAFILTGALVADVAVIFPAIGRTYFVANQTTGNFSVTLKAGAAATTLVIPQGKSGYVTLNVNDVLGPSYIGQVRQRVITASTTYTPDIKLAYAIAELVGGGGGGAGVPGVALDSYGGGGGGAGGYSRKLLTPSDIGASKAVTIGVAGAAALAGPNAGGNGGDTSIGSLVIAKGGSGGGTVGSFTQPGAGGIAGTGDIAATGESGGVGSTITGNPTNIAPTSGYGGSSQFGGGGAARLISGGGTSNGAAGTGYGAGGGGGVQFVSSSGAAGGAGTAGICIITEYLVL